MSTVVASYIPYSTTSGVPSSPCNEKENCMIKKSVGCYTKQCWSTSVSGSNTVTKEIPVGVTGGFTFTMLEARLCLFLGTIRRT